jgi:uncharacterized RDD family membrane protein YckC
MTHTAPDPVLDSQFYDGVPTRRFVAFCIDVVVVFAIWLVVLVLGLVLTVVTLGLGAPLAALAASVTDFLYRWFLLAEGSATLGMRLTGIELRDAAGRRLDPVTAFLHVAGFYVSLVFLPLLVIGWILMAASPHRRLLHDTVLGTVAINRPA